MLEQKQNTFAVASRISHDEGHIPVQRDEPEGARSVRHVRFWSVGDAGQVGVAAHAPESPERAWSGAARVSDAPRGDAGMGRSANVDPRV